MTQRNLPTPPLPRTEFPMAGLAAQGRSGPDAEPAFPRDPYKVAGWISGKSGDVRTGFIEGHVRIEVISSNIAWAQYMPDFDALEIGFLNGSVYRVGSFSPAEAAGFYDAPSRGIWYWEHVRVRGPGNGHLTRKPYARIG